MILLFVNITNLLSQKIKNRKKRKKIIAHEETTFKNKIELDTPPVVIVTNREGISNNMRRIAYVINEIGDNRKWGLTYFESRYQDVSQWFCLFDFIDLSDQTPSCIHLTEFSEIRLETCHFSALGPFDITSSTQKVDTRARARAIALKIENTAASQTWKLGTFRLDTQPDGRR